MTMEEIDSDYGLMTDNWNIDGRERYTVKSVDLVTQLQYEWIDK